MGRAQRNPSTLTTISTVRHCCINSARCINPRPHHLSERRIGPCSDRWCMAVLYRVPMNVVDVALKIVLVSQCVFPIAPLPNPSLAYSETAFGNVFIRRQSSREARFDLPPSCRIVCITLRQGPYRMKMIGQNDHRFDGKRMPATDIPKCRPKQIDMLDEQVCPAIREIQGEEERSACDEISTITSH